MIEASVPTIERAYRVRLHPSEAQASPLRRLFGAQRRVLRSDNITDRNW